MLGSNIKEINDSLYEQIKSLNYLRLKAHWGTEGGSNWNKNFITSGFRRELDKKCVLPVYYAASSGNLLPTFRENLSVPSWRVKKMGPISALPGYYAASIGSSLLTFGDNLSGLPSRDNFEDGDRPWRWDRQLAPKRRYEITTTRCVITQKSAVPDQKLFPWLVSANKYTILTEVSARLEKRKVTNVLRFLPVIMTFFSVIPNVNVWLHEECTRAVATSQSEASASQNTGMFQIKILLLLFAIFCT